MVVAPEMRAIFRRLAPDFALDNFQTMQEALDQNNFSARLGLYLVGAFARLAVLMVMAGLFGVLAQTVSYRRREIGVRLALGATPRTTTAHVPAARFEGGWIGAGGGSDLGALYRADCEKFPLRRETPRR